MGSSSEAAILDEPARFRVVRSSASALSFWKCRRTQARLDVASRPAASKDLVEEQLAKLAGGAPVAAWH